MGVLSWSWPERPLQRKTRRTSVLLDLWMVGHEMSALLDEALASLGVER